MAPKPSPGLTPYPYSDLPTPTSFRILKVLPRDQNKNGHIAITLGVVDLKDNSRYTALSYTWGNPFTVYAEEEEDKMRLAESAAQTKKSIFCGGHYIQVTKNCHDFLKVAQQVGQLVTSPQYARWIHGKQVEHNLVPDDLGYFWIDAICINQSSIPERSAQVRIMRDIYDQASLVLIWLGLQDVFSHEAIDVLESVANVSPNRWESADTLNSGMTFVNRKFYDHLGIPIIHARQWQSVYAFLERSWFVRGWIIQEICLARRAMILCGTRCFSFRVLLIASNAFFLTDIMGNLVMMNQGYSRVKSSSFTDAEEFNKALLSDVPTYAISPTMSGTIGWLGRHPPPDGQAVGAQTPKGNLIDMHGRRKLILTMPPSSTAGQLQLLALLSKPDDKVYAFMGLAAESCWSSFPIDYTRSTKQTYTMVTRQMMITSKSVRALSLCPDRRRRRLTDLPSWVPDFSVARIRQALDNGFDRLMGTYFPLHFDASRALNWYDNDIDLSLPLLSLQGIHCATVNTRGTASYCLYGPEKKNLFFDWLEFGRTTRCSIEELVQTISGIDASRATKDVNYPSLDMVVESFKTYVEDLLFQKHIDLITSSNHIQTSIDTFLQADEIFMKKFTLYSELTEPIYLGPQFTDIHVRTLDRILATLVLKEQNLHSQETQPNTQWTPDDYRTLLSIFEKPPCNAHTSEKLSESCRLINAGNHDCILFQTESRGYDQGKIGHGPISTSKNDEIWILAGGKVPYILRAIENDEYEFIGEAYLDGIMYGEAVESENRQVRTITLR
ncbi:heterokaryon incompatibility protein-domain-containing protein [Hyaloscypha finlandica]|nr:heterokaryon incompatibility protein-domain-containing protein [Hyaloscypha finlandica]